MVQENTCTSVSILIKLQAEAEFAKLLRTPFFTEHLRWLLLYSDDLKQLNLLIWKSFNNFAFQKF